MVLGGVNNHNVFGQGFGFSASAGIDGGAAGQGFYPGINPGVPENFAERLEKSAAGLADKNAAAGAAPNDEAALPKKDAIDKSGKLYEMCVELETFLIKNLVTSMRGTVQKSGLLDTGFAGKMYEDMLYDEYAKNMSKNAGFGFAEMAYTELNRMEKSLNLKA